jgi:cation transporter-like permease
VPVVSVTETKARELEDEIDQLYNQVNRLQQSRRELTGHALSVLRESRAILHTQPERYGRAEYNVRQVRIILDRARDGRRRSLRYGVLLLVYLALWLTVCASAITSLFLYGRDVQIILEAALGGDSRLAANTVSVLWAVLGGAAGGVLGAIASLATHLRQGQEFDRQYVLRYTIQPIMGVVLALFIYLLCSFFANALEADLTAGQVSSLLPAAIAFPAGLWQEMVYALLYRLSGVFRFGSRRR